MIFTVIIIFIPITMIIITLTVILTVTVIKIIIGTSNGIVQLKDEGTSIPVPYAQIYM